MGSNVLLASASLESVGLLLLELLFHCMREKMGNHKKRLLLFLHYAGWVGVGGLFIGVVLQNQVGQQEDSGNTCEYIDSSKAHNTRKPNAFVVTCLLSHLSFEPCYESSQEILDQLSRGISRVLNLNHLNHTEAIDDRRQMSRLNTSSKKSSMTTRDRNPDKRA